MPLLLAVLAALAMAVPAVAGDDAPRACSATWLRLPQPHELPYSLDEWTVMLLADGQDPEALEYSSERVADTDPPDNGTTFLWFGSGPQTHGPVVVARLGGNCYGPGICTGATYLVRARAPSGECAELVLAFPYDHSGGQ